MKTKSGKIAIAGIALLTVIIAVCLIFIKPNTVGDPTVPSETTPTNPIETIQDLDMVSVDVYGDIFIAQKDGFEFENPKTNKCQLSFKVVCGDITLFESEFISPGEKVKWDTKKVGTGFYDSYVIVSTKNVESGKEGNGFSLKQIFYIDETAPIETNKLFTVSIPERLNITIKDGEVTITDNMISIIKNTNQDGAPLPRTENMSVSALGIEKEETIMYFEFENTTAEGEEVNYVISMKTTFPSEPFADGEYDETTMFQFDGYSESNILQ